MKKQGVKVEFNEGEYLEANPDVATVVKEGGLISGREHYDKYGKNEGRLLKRKFGRREKVFHLLDKAGRSLEIGPSFNPIAPKKDGFNVDILDHASTQELLDKYQGHGVNLDNIEDVNFVWHGEPLQELVGSTHCYDWIIASHVIEHVPDLISYLQQCEKLLKLKGVLSLVIQDKRYCFDYFSSISSTGNVLDAYAERRIKPSPGQIFDQFSNASKRNGDISWSADAKGGADELSYTFSEAQDYWQKSISTADYIDAHCWRLTPAFFRLLIADLQALGLISFEIKAEFDTVGCEFYVSLGKREGAFMEKDRLDALQAIKLESL